MQNFALIKIITNSQPEIRDKKRHEKSIHTRKPHLDNKKKSAASDNERFFCYIV